MADNDEPVSKGKSGRKVGTEDGKCKLEFEAQFTEVVTFEANPTGFLDILLKNTSGAKTHRSWAAGCLRKAIRNSVFPGAQQGLSLCGAGAPGPAG